MKLVVISYVYNEQDIVESFVRHHAAVADRMIVVDHGSTDRTPDILHALQAEGLPLEIRQDSSPMNNHPETMTALLHELHDTHAADWIAPLDADEFLIGTTGDIRSAIASLRGDRVTLVPWRTYVPDPERTVTPDILRTVTERRIKETKTYYKILVPAGAVLPESRVIIGSHALDGTAEKQQPTDTLAIAHFPVRTPLQIRRKVRDGWKRHLANPNRKPTENFHWAKLEQHFRTNSIVSPLHLRQIALCYGSTEKPADIRVVCDPVPVSFDLRYSGGVQ